MTRPLNKIALAIGILITILVGLACFAVIVAINGCSTPAILTPPSGPGTEYPCGVNGVECESKLCCPQGFTCGGGTYSVGCPKDECCFVEENPTMGARRNVKQTEPTFGR